jgi:hypothetical protein
MDGLNEMEISNATNEDGDLYDELKWMEISNANEDGDLYDELKWMEISNGMDEWMKGTFDKSQLAEM